MPKSNERGFVLVFPVLIVGAILLLSFTFSSFKSRNNVDTTAVLSESDDDGGDGDNSGTGSSSSGSSSTSETSKPSSLPESSTPKPESEVQSSTPKPQFFSSTKAVKFNSKEQELKNKKINQSPKPTPKTSPKPSQTIKPEKTPEAEIEDEIEDEDEKDFGLGESSTPQPMKVKIEVKDGIEHFEVENANVSISKEGPVKVDEKTGELTITTPSGEKTVAFLPEDAIENILGSNSVNELEINSETGKTELKLTINSNGVPVYEVEGIKKGRFLGVFNVNIKKTVQISAIDGAEGSVTVSGFDKFLDLLSL